MTGFHFRHARCGHEPDWEGLSSRKRWQDGPLKSDHAKLNKNTLNMQKRPTLNRRSRMASGRNLADRRKQAFQNSSFSGLHLYGSGYARRQRNTVAANLDRSGLPLQLVGVRFRDCVGWPSANGARGDQGRGIISPPASQCKTALSRVYPETDRLKRAGKLGDPGHSRHGDEPLRPRPAAGQSGSGSEILNQVWEAT